MVLAALFVIAAGWRLAYIVRLTGSPLAGSMFDDARIYWAWSERIASGHLVGSNPFFLAPLYPYVLGAIRTLSGPSSTSVLVIQALWGAAAVALLADAVRRLTRPAIAMVVGIMMAFYEMAVFFDGLLLTESLLFALGALLLWWMVRSEGMAMTWRTAGVAGVLVGLFAAGRATMALLMLPSAFLLCRNTSRWSHALALCGGFAVVAAPITWHNHAVGREWIPFTYNAGFNLHAGNNAEAIGTYVPIAGKNESQPQGTDGGVELDGRDFLKRSEGLDLSPSASSSYWGRKAMAYLLQEPGHAFRLAAVKLAMMWNVREYPQIESVDEYRALAGPVGLPVIGGFAILGVLALVGAVSAWGAGAAGRFALGYAVVVTMSTVPFFVTDRYRHQIIPACAVLAGLGLQHLWRAWSDRSGRWGSFIALVAALVVVHLGTPGPTHHQQAALLATNMAVRLQASAAAAARSGNLEQAEREFTLAVEADPRLYEAWGGLIRVQVGRGRTAEARDTFARARAAGLTGPTAHAYDALLAALSHDAAAAEAALRSIPPTSLAADPTLADVVAVTRRILSGR